MVGQSEGAPADATTTDSGGRLNSGRDVLSPSTWDPGPAPGNA